MADAEPKHWRRWFQFRLRTLLVVVALVSAGLAIVSSRANQRRRAVERIKSAGGIVGYDFECDEKFNRRADNPTPPGPDWLRNLIGVDYFATPVYVESHNANDEALTALAELPNLRALELTDDLNITDAGLESLKDLAQLEMLYIDGCEQLTDASLQHLRKLKRLSALVALGTRITSEGIKELKQEIPNLATDVDSN
jgi:hypothetical protein